MNAALDQVPVSTAIAGAVAGAENAVLAVPCGAVDDVDGALGDPGDTIVVDATNTVGVALPDGVDRLAQPIRT